MVGEFWTTDSGSKFNDVLHGSRRSRGSMAQASQFSTDLQARFRSTGPIPHSRAAA